MYVRSAAQVTICVVQLLCSSNSIVFQRILWFSVVSNSIGSWVFLQPKNANSNNSYDEKEKPTCISTPLFPLCFMNLFRIEIFRGFFFSRNIHSRLLHFSRSYIRFITQLFRTQCVNVSLSLSAFAWLHSAIFYEFIQFIIFPFALIVYSLHGYTHIRLLLWIYALVFIIYSSLPLFAYLLIYPKIAKNTFIIKLFLVSSNYKVSFVHCTAKTIELFVSINLNCYCAVYLTFSLPFRHASSHPFAWTIPIWLYGPGFFKHL